MPLTRPSLPLPPESHSSGLRRKDSKNALTTCHGITTAGRACRRPIAKARSAIGARDYATSGSFVIPQAGEDPAVFFCHQHKEQAELLLGRDGGGSVVEVGGGRGSLEEVFRELRLEEVDEEEEGDSSGWSGGESLPQGMRTSQRQIPTKPGRRRSAQDRSGPQSVALRYSPRSRSVPRIPLEIKHESSTTNIREENSRPLSYEAQATLREPHSPRSDLEKRRRRKTRSKPESSAGFWSSLFSCLASENLDNTPSRVQSHQKSQRPRSSPNEKSALMDDHPSSRRRRTRSEARRSRGSYGAYPSHQRGSSPNPFESDPSRTPNEQYFPRATRKSANNSPRRRLSRPGDDRLVSSDENEDVKQKPIRTPAVPKASITVVTPGRRKSSGYPSATNFSDTHDGPSTERQIAISPASPLSQPFRPSPSDENWLPQLPRNPSNATRIGYAKLLTAMSEPPTRSDTPGYIYIFWQTEAGAVPTAAESAAAAFVIGVPPSGRFASDARAFKQRFSQQLADEETRSRGEEGRTIFLKIGRAANVHQRLNQWRKQCEYDVSLLRYYPYDVEDGSAATGGRKMAYVGKVERLIHLHLEMLGMRVKRACRCGAEHREWFEVEASVQGVKEVDAVVREWVEWSEGRFGREV